MRKEEKTKKNVIYSFCFNIIQILQLEMESSVKANTFYWRISFGTQVNVHFFIAKILVVQRYLV